MRILNEVQDSYGTGLWTLTVRDFREMQPHLDAWDRLASEAPQRNPCLLPAWVEAGFCVAEEQRRSWLCSFAYAGERLVGVLPVFLSPHPVLGRSFPTVETCDPYAPSGDILLAPAHARPAFAALLEELARAAPNHLGLDLKAVRPSSPLLAVLDACRPHYLACPGKKHPFSYLDVRGGDCESYFRTLGKMRKNLRVGRKRLEEQGAVTAEMRRGEAAGEDFLPTFLDLESSGWKGRNGTSIRDCPGKTSLYTHLARNLAARGELEWHIVRVGGSLAAAQFAVRCGNSLMLPKYAYDEAFAAGMPGHILMEEVIRDAFARPEIAELNPMSDSEQHRLLHMPREDYVDWHLVRRNAVAFTFQLPRALKEEAYEEWVRPHIPKTLRHGWRRFKRRRGRASPPRSAPYR